MKAKTILIIISLLFVYMAFNAERATAAEFANAHFLVETEWLSGHLDDPELRIIDARKRADYEQGHIPNAVHLDRKEVTAVVNGVKGMLAPITEIERVFGKKGMDNHTKIIIYDSITGTSAARIFWILDYVGHKDMALLNGGWAKWVREKRGVVQKIPEPEATTYKASPDENKRVDAAWINRNLDNPDVLLLDVRSEDEYTGKVARSARGGHIPGAINLEWKMNLTEQGTIKDPSELRNMYYKYQIKKGNVIVVYCQSGRRASQSYFVLRLLGYDRLRLYDGSWGEWGNSDRYPVQTGAGNTVRKTWAAC